MSGSALPLLVDLFIPVEMINGAHPPAERFPQVGCSSICWAFSTGGCSSICWAFSAGLRYIGCSTGRAIFFFFFDKPHEWMDECNFIFLSAKCGDTLSQFSAPLLLALVQTVCYVLAWCYRTALFKLNKNANKQTIHHAKNPRRFSCLQSIMLYSWRILISYSSWFPPKIQRVLLIGQ